MPKESLIFLVVALVLSIIVALIIVLSVISSRRKKKRYDFVLNHSVAIRELLELNEKTSYIEIKYLNLKHEYDNTDYYETISCDDYLIYYLQDYKNDIIKGIADAEENAHRYKRYLEYVSDIKKTLGKFDAPYNAKGFNKLKEIEKSIFVTYEISEPIKYHVYVALSNIARNGYIKDEKFCFYQKDRLLRLISLVEDKNGDYYNNKPIWDAICRVERGKVSNVLRGMVFDRDHHRCKMCGRSDLETDLEVDHIIPISKGGKSTLNNLQTLCHDCNYNKGNKIIK